MEYEEELPPVLSRRCYDAADGTFQRLVRMPPSKNHSTLPRQLILSPALASPLPSSNQAEPLALPLRKGGRGFNISVICRAYSSDMSASFVKRKDTEHCKLSAISCNGRKHFQADLAEELQCSPQTIIRLMSEIESVVGIGLESGIENRKKWYQIKSISRPRLGLDFKELLYLAICRDLANSVLPADILKRIDDTLFNLSVLMADHDYAEREKVQGKQFSFFSKGKIDYTPHFAHIEKLTNAIENRKICLLRYKASEQGEIKEHRFAPNKIITMNNALYVLGATLFEDCLQEKHFLNFAIHRIADIILLERSFKLDFPEIDAQSFGLSWHHPKEFSIRFVAGKAADYVRERIWVT